ncbi:MAG: hypothetical protein KC933_04695 [Myxococcales bacterium]|nr:hypothetical protein [Myxococcales bacterium]
MDRSLVRSSATGLVPTGEDSPEFRRYRDRTWLQVTAGTAVVTTVGMAAAFLMGGSLGGVLGFVAGVGLGLGAGVWSGLKMSALANRGLRRRLRSALGVRGRGIFVGLRAEQGGLWSELQRKETDDSVGFLELEAQHLVITTEVGKVALRSDDVRGFRRERVKAVPMLSFVRVLLNHDGFDASFLIVSREGDTLRAQVEATEVLYGRLVEWHAEHQLAWLARHRALESG